MAQNYERHNACQTFPFIGIKLTSLSPETDGLNSPRCVSSYRVTRWIRRNTLFNAKCDIIFIFISLSSSTRFEVRADWFPSLSQFFFFFFFTRENLEKDSRYFIHFSYLRESWRKEGDVKVEHGGSFWRLYKLSTYRSNTSQTVCATWSHTGARRQPRLPDIPEGRIPDLQTSRQCLPFQRIDLWQTTRAEARSMVFGNRSCRIQRILHFSSRVLNAFQLIKHALFEYLRRRINFSRKFTIDPFPYSCIYILLNYRI